MGKSVMHAENDVEKVSRVYIDQFKKCINEIPMENLTRAVKIIYEAYLKNKKVFIMGNGGSAATASHFACDLLMGTKVHNKPRFRVISLNDNTPLVTAISNDYGYDKVFKEQLISLVEEGDVVILITASGNSENVLQAHDYAKAQGAVTIGLIGFGGGKLKSLVDEHITLSSKNFGIVETAHSFLAHLIAFYFKRKLENA